jgi:hypothetical protein
MRATLLILGFAYGLFPGVVRADAVVTTSLALTRLQILPAAGAVQLLSPWTAFVFAQAEDSLGGLDASTSSVFDSGTSVTATTALANASTAASFPALNESTASGINISTVASASSSGQGQLSGSFEIVGATGPVRVVFNALLASNQSLSTSGGGISASSETVFNLLSPDLNGGSSFLFFDNPLTIGANSSTSDSASPTLTTSLMLDSNTPYFLIAGVDAESSGRNIPEPSLLVAVAFGLAALVLARFRRRRCTHYY